MRTRVQELVQKLFVSLLQWPKVMCIWSRALLAVALGTRRTSGNYIMSELSLLNPRSIPKGSTSFRGPKGRCQFSDPG